MKCLRKHCLGFAFFAAQVSMSAAYAGARPQVDLSVHVSTTPSPFEPGGIVTVTMEVHNAGPDVAGATLPGQRTLFVFENGYDITSSPPPYLLFEPATGCSAYAEESEPIFPGPHFFYIFSFRFDSIGPGESRICTYRLRVGPSTQSFDTSWAVFSPNDDDTDPTNNRFDYSLVAAPAVATPLTAASSPTLIAMALAILLVGCRVLRVSMRSPVR